MRALLALDTRDPATNNHLLNLATRWLDEQQATVDFVFIMHDGQSVALDALLQSQVDQIHATERIDRLAELQLMMMTMPKARRGKCHVGHAPDVAAKICSLGEHYDAVLMGTHHRKGLQRYVLGSVAEQVVRKSETPVLVIPLPPADANA